MSDDPARPEPELLTITEAAELVRAPVATLRYWRHLATGPRSFRLGRRVLYRSDDLRSWIDAQHDDQGSPQRVPGGDRPDPRRTPPSTDRAAAVQRRGNRRQALPRDERAGGRPPPARGSAGARREAGDRRWRRSRGGLMARTGRGTATSTARNTPATSSARSTPSDGSTRSPRPCRRAPTSTPSGPGRPWESWRPSGSPGRSTSSPPAGPATPTSSRPTSYRAGGTSR